MTVQELRNQMEKDGTPFATFREEIRDEIIMQRLREHEVDAKIQISDAEVDNFLDAEKAAAANRSSSTWRKFSCASRKTPGPKRSPQRRARAEEVSRQLRTGADFAKMAATYSDASDALSGGDIGWRHSDRLPPLFTEAAAETEAGPDHADHQEQHGLPHPESGGPPQRCRGASRRRRAADACPPHPAESDADPVGGRSQA